MLDGGFTFEYQKDFLGLQSHVVYAHVGSFNSMTQADTLCAVPNDLEYIFQLIRSHFLFIVPHDDCVPPIQHEGKAYHQFLLNILSLPFTSNADKSEIGLWNDIVDLVSYEFGNRMDYALRGNCTGKELFGLVQNCIEDFDYEDRERLEANKLTNLVAFVYDYCMLTMKEAHLYRKIDHYVDGKVEIHNKTIKAPLRLCALVRQYCANGGTIKDGDHIVGVNYDLPTVRLKKIIQNPHASDSNIAAMFVDLMHKFFLSFGLKKYGKSEWAKAERWMIYELLRLFGLCNSTKPAKESKYVTTVINDYGDYFSSCNLRSWIREEQAYCHLICCTPEQLTSIDDGINEPFISPQDYKEIKKSQPETSSKEAEYVELSPNDYPPELKAFLSEVRGNSYRVTHNESDRLMYGPVSYLTVMPKKRFMTEMPQWDPRLDYVMKLIESSFEYITLMPSIAQNVVMRQDLHDPEQLKQLVGKLEKDLLNRMDIIPRGNFTREKAMTHINSFLPRCTKEERSWIDVDKLYVLFLFIYDYVYITYKESVISPGMRLFVSSSIRINNESFPSTLLNDDMLSSFLENPLVYVPDKNETDFYPQLKEAFMDEPKRPFLMEHPSCNVKNMTAMFFDLFARFFKNFGLAKKSNVKYASDLESTLIGELAYCSGIFSSNNPASARAMFMTNQDYFKKSSLDVSIRENEYGYLMLNTMTEDLFRSKTVTEDTDS